MGWFRWHDGSTTDPKFRVVARLAAKTVEGVRLSDVLALWAMLLERANGGRDGIIEGFDCDVADAHLDLPDGASCAIVRAMQDKKLLSGEVVTNWEKRQPKKEDLTAAQRKRDQRAKEKMSRNVTPGHDVTTGVTPGHDRLDKTRQDLSPQSPPTGGQDEVFEAAGAPGDDADLSPDGLDGDQGAGGESPPAETRGRRKRYDRPAHGDRPQSYGAFKACYGLYPIKQAEEDAWCEWCRLEDNGTLAEHFEIREAIIRHLDEDVRWKTGHAPLMAKWLAGKRWLDEPVTATADAPEGPPPPKSYSDEQLVAMGIKGPTW